MADLNEAFGRKLAELIRDNGEKTVTIRLLSAVLKYVDVHHQLPADSVAASLDMLRATPEFQSIAQQYEPLVRELECAVDLRECARIFQTIPSSRLAN